MKTGELAIQGIHSLQIPNNQFPQRLYEVIIVCRMIMIDVQVKGQRRVY